MKRLSLIISIICLILVCVISFLKSNVVVDKEETLSVTATITDKEHKKTYTTMMHITTGKTTTLIPQTHPEKFLVTVEYQNLTETFDDEDLYNSVDCGDSIEIILYKTFNKKGKLLDESLKLP